MRDRIILTIDLEWAPEYMLDHVFGMLSESGSRATLFATHDSKAVKDAGGAFEVGLHPAVSALAEMDEAICRLKDIFPYARAIRTHGLVNASGFLQVYKKHGLSVTSNYLMTGQAGIRPVPMLYDILEYPIYYMDDVHLAETDHIDTSSLIKGLIEKPGVKVLAFHPMYIYLNSNSIERYRSVRGHLHDKKRMDDCINKAYGIGTFFKELIRDPDIKGRTGDFPGTGDIVVSAKSEKA